MSRAMELVTTAYLDPEGRVMFVVHGDHCQGVVDARTGRYELRGAPCRVTEAVTRALSEWYATDRAHFGGRNAAKVEVALRRTR